MGKSLLTLPIFAAAISKCQEALRPHGVDVIDIITSDDSRIFSNILNCFVGIAACQVCIPKQVVYYTPYILNTVTEILKFFFRTLFMIHMSMFSQKSRSLDMLDFLTLIAFYWFLINILCALKVQIIHFSLRLL
jgi:hypothetical protein